MDKRLQTLGKPKILFFTLAVALFAVCPAFSQQIDQSNKIRIQIWSEMDAFPGHFDKEMEDSTTVAAEKIQQQLNETLETENRDATIFAYAIARAKEIAPFLIEGMIHGWTFDYVPYDKTRQVDEYFEFGRIRELDKTVNPVTYKEPLPRAGDGRLLCWIECERTPEQQLSFQRWKTITNPKVRGHGTAPVEKGFDGIQEACAQALKNAVREYWRTKTKNKPKEISGTALLIQEPRVYIKDGNYVVDLDFFLETDKIVSYSYY
ncbi:MAG: hypothetical protein J6W60_09655 [Treponema sp.]|nr:hypothetical protein [Treponema sp.]MBR6153729.1 hypothetical protein [Treponema sp.]MBR7079439.1 hypothetical protein [Treponema sp.]